MPIIVNQIADVLESRLSALEGDTVGGVQMSLVRANARGVSPQHGQIAIKYGPNTRYPEYDVPGAEFRPCRQQVFEVCIYIRDESDERQMTEQAYEVVGQVVYRVTEVGATDWYTFKKNIGTDVAPIWQPLAVDADIGDYELIEPSGGLGGVIVPVIVQYRTSQTALDVVG